MSVYLVRERWRESGMTPTPRDTTPKKDRTLCTMLELHANSSDGRPNLTFVLLAAGPVPTHVRPCISISVQLEVGLTPHFIVKHHGPRYLDAAFSCYTGSDGVIPFSCTRSLRRPVHELRLRGL